MRGAAGRLGIAAAWLVPAAAPVVPLLAEALHIERRLESAGRCVALTFDDGPHPDGTPATLERLRETGAQATFFLVGEQVEKNPGLAAEISAAGHEIALHGYRHRLLLRRTVSELADDLDRAMDVIVSATGQEPSCYRPPYGVFSAGGLDLVRRRGLRPVLWSKWGRDWKQRATPETIARLVTRSLGADDIVLLHDADYYSVPSSWRNTVGALPRILACAEALRLTCETLSA